MSAKVKISPAEVLEVETDAAEDLLKVEQYLKSVAIGRSREIRGLLLAVVSGQHMMMEGEPGIAKTMLAKEFAACVTAASDEDFCFFKVQLSRGMVSDQLLGPTNIMKLREEATYEYNTARMLPKAHIAVLDEVYRGPEMLLPVILSILNEREFHNGSHVDKCPLITAVGTTNFTTNTEELKAFHDRWLVNVAVERLSSAEERLSMLTASLKDHPPRKATVGLHQIRELHEQRKQVVVEKPILQLYDALVQQIISRGRNTLRVNISDRRMAQALRLAQASALLKQRTKVTPDDLLAVEYGLIFKGLKTEETIFSDAYQAEVGNFQQIQKEEEQLTMLREVREKFHNAYKEELPKERLLKLREALKTTINEARGWTFRQPANTSEFKRIFHELESLLSQVAQDLSTA